MTEFVQSVDRFIRQHDLMRNDGRYIVAVSGGADSVALLRVLLQLGFSVHAAHCNFHLRGAESDRDEAFVKQLCQSLNVPLHLVHFDTHTYANLHHVSIEMAARQLRYRYFEQLRQDLGCQAVCVAHHRDDSVETVLINLIRGTGIHGLTGIKPQRPSSTGSDGIIVRPLLCLSREEIEAWLGEMGQDYVVDSTNLTDDVVRNQIRLNLIPLLKHINPTAVSNIQKAAKQVAEAEKAYQAYCSSFIIEAITDNSLEISELKKSASPISILYEWLRNYHFPPATIRQINDSLDSQTGHVWHSPTHIVCIDRGRLLLAPLPQSSKPMNLPEPGTYVCSNEMKLQLTVSDDLTVCRSANCACLDADKVSFPLTLRPIHQGDRFTPFGMKGSKLVSDFLTDLKVPMPERRCQQVVTDASGTIVWVVGRRPSATCCLTPASTRQLRLQIFFGTLFVP